MPRPDRKVFTYSENQLLDQITTEIIHAWKDDLKKIRQANEVFKEKSASLLHFSQMLLEKLPLLCEYIDSAEYRDHHKTLVKNNDEINFRMSEMNKSLFELTEQMKGLREVKNDYDQWKRNSNIKKPSIWRKIFGQSNRLEEK